MSTEAESLLRQARLLIEQADRITQRESERDQRTAELAEKLGGEDSWSVGDVITWKRRLNGVVYTYAAVCHPKGWAITGRGDQARCSWNGLLAQLQLPGVCVIRYMTEYQEVTP